MAAASGLVSASTSGGIKVDAATIAQPFRDEIRQKVELLRQQGIGKSRPILSRSSIPVPHHFVSADS
jgi:hypothetical protein